MRLTRCQTFASALLLVLLLAGCGHTIPASLTGGKPYDFGAPHQCIEPQPDREKVEVRYLGSGGVYLRWRDDAILIGASFSNPNVVRARFLRVKPNKKRVETALGDLDLRSVRAIFAGHSHYDHIADLPAVAQAIPGVPIHVNLSGARALDGEDGLRDRIVPLEAGKAIDVTSSIRVRAVVSGHAPQLCRWSHAPCVYAKGELPARWTTPLTHHRLASMLGGQTYAFAIELHDGDTVRYRIYYNDAAADSPLGQIAGDFDLAILCLAQWNYARDYPRDLLDVLRPRHVVVSHWDNFFVEARQSTRFVPTVSNANAAGFLRVVDQYVSGSGGPVNEVCGVKTAHWTMPAPRSSMLFVPTREKPQTTDNGQPTTRRERD
jgi:L-ascorbate metabolism protein UlaG (beta-lactamase superfamily)